MPLTHLARRRIPLRRVRRRFVVALGMSLAVACSRAVIDGPPPPPVPPPPPPDSTVIAVFPSSVTLDDTLGTAASALARVFVTASSGRPAVSLGDVRYGAGADGWLRVQPDSATPPLGLTVSAALDGLVPGTYTATVPVRGAGAANSPQILTVTLAVTAAPPPPPPPPGSMVTIAGNIASCGGQVDDQTAALVDSIGGTVITAGDNAFPNGTADNYRDCYEPSWGRFKARTWGVMGNHEYNTGNATGAFDYWGDRAGPRDRGWYSLDVGTWHVVVLNDNLDVSRGSEQLDWLRADLAAHPVRCTLAVWHQPLFLSSNTPGFTERPLRRAIWDVLADAGADVVVNGHQHHYERMAPMRPDGTRDDAAGIRQFNAGTGGESVVMPAASVHPNSEVRSATFGVLALNLRDGGYDWRFVPVHAQPFTDSGSGTCH